MSEGVVRIVVKLSAHMPYQAARDVYEEVAGVAVSVGEIWNLTQAAGQRSRSALQPLPTMKETLESAACVGVSMDGFMANVRAEGWKEVKIGAIFEAYVTGQSGQVRGRSQSYVMHLGGPEGFGFKLAMEAQARRWSQAAQSAVVGDGAAWIWNLAARDYPDAAHIVDWYHAKQHLCAAAELLYPNQPEQAAAWVDQHSAMLYEGQAKQIAKRLAQHTQSEQLLTEARYFETNHERMQYRDFESAHLPIGSGIVESGAKQAKQRLCAPGMRWSRAGLENMLPLRAALMSGTFDQLWPRICPRL
jgi:hypothetical protein